MNSKKYFFIILFFLYSCTAYDNVQNTPKSVNKINFKNKGFALTYEDFLYKNKIVSKKMNPRDLLIFQRNLKKNTPVIIKNIINNKTIIAKVGSNANYPSFNNSVVSIRISNELELDFKEPYVEIIEILNNSSFIAKKAKIYDEEKVVADKAPIESISINNLNINDANKTEKKSNKNFKYIIKIADFYFKNTAKKEKITNQGEDILQMMERIKKETKINNIHVRNLSETNFRVFLGPFYNLNSLQNAFNDISILQFESLEIIKHD